MNKERSKRGCKWVALVIICLVALYAAGRKAWRTFTSPPRVQTVLPAVMAGARPDVRERPEPEGAGHTLQALRQQGGQIAADYKNAALARPDLVAFVEGELYRQTWGRFLWGIETEPSGGAEKERGEWYALMYKKYVWRGLNEKSLPQFIITRWHVEVVGKWEELPAADALHPSRYPTIIPLKK